jgi:acetyl esterase/lipase
MKSIHRILQARSVAGGLLPMLLALPCSEAGDMRGVSASESAVQAVQADGARSRYVPLPTDARLGDLLRHPAFHGFAHRILPWDDRAYDEAMPLADIGRLLPYHSHVNPDVVLGSLNRMVDDINAGRMVFYDVYSDVERQRTPALRHTGLFFFRGKPGAPFAVIAPGGGFAYVGSVHEGFPYAEEISRRGFNAFVLKYRVGQGGRPAMEDLAAAVSFIFQHANALQVDTAGYALWGSSAGARMAAAIGSHGTASFGARPLPKPSVVVMAYTGHSDVAVSEPPTFVVVGERDGIAPPMVMEARIAALRRIGTEVEYHQYPEVGHGFGTGQGTRAQGWIDQAIAFWQKTIRRKP